MTNRQQQLVLGKDLFHYIYTIDLEKEDNVKMNDTAIALLLQDIRDCLLRMEKRQIENTDEITEKFKRILEEIE